jgi:lipopolysaccharide assembly protein B
MEFDPWMLVLLPAFFAAGWFAARWDLRQTISAAKKLPATYFQGIDHLLHDEHDQALAALIDVVKQDPDTPELHFALGALYRRRGETDRAIRVHENLLARRDLPEAYRQRAQLEVGLDYVKAGLLKQAETALNELEGTVLAVKAEEQRIRLAQSERDWPLAIQMARALRAAGHEREARFELHYHASQAEDAMSLPAPNLIDAQESLRQAAVLDANHARTLLLNVKLSRLSGNRESMTGYLQQLAQHHPDYIALAAHDWMLAHKGDKAASALSYLQALWQQHPSIDLAHFILQQAEHANDASQFDQWAKQAVQQQASSRLLQLWLASQSARQNTSQALQITAEQLATLNAKSGRFVCNHCRFQARQHYWQCPGCGLWETYAPHLSS